MEVTQEWGLGKERTEVGKWLDVRGYTQEDLSRMAEISRNTASRSCNDLDYYPSPQVQRKILKALREIDPSLQAHHLWKI